MAPARNMVIACAAALAACSQRPASSEPAAPAQPAQPAPPTQTQRSDVGCAAPLDAPGARAQIRAAAGKLRLGVLAGLKDADDVNVAHLRKLVAGLPGTMDRRLLHADGACVYVQKDLEALTAFLDKLPAKEPPAVLAMAVPPRGRDRRALDFSDGLNVGDPRIAPLLTIRRAP